VEVSAVIGTEPYGELRYTEVIGTRMAYIDEGEGEAIVFAHGNPTSSYVWRNVMPYLNKLGRLVAADMVGMGGSDKLRPSGPERYRYAEHRDYLFALWDALDLGDDVVLVGDDWGATLCFDWARRHPNRVQGIVHMEAVAAPMFWSEFPEQGREMFQAFRSAAGERMVLEDNIFIEERLPGAVMRELTEEEMNHYRRPYTRAGEDRRVLLSWPRSLPIDGEPADVVAVVEENGKWLSATDMPKLFINAEPGTLVRGRTRDFVRSWPNQAEITVKGIHTVQEDSPDEIGLAIADFVRCLRGSRPH
jgi:haloalkane dehalogenase